jgi:signal transduction histidine kinase
VQHAAIARLTELASEVTLGPRSLPPLAGGIVGICLALFLALRPGEGRVRVWFAIVAFFATLWAWAVAVALGAQAEDVAHWSARISYAAIALVAPCAVAFGAALTKIRTRVTAPSLVASALVAIACLAIPSLTKVAPRPGNAGWWPLPSLGLLLAALSTIPPTTWAAWLMLRAWRALPPCRRRRQLAWACAALSVGALGGIDLITVYTRTYPFAWATTALGSVTLFYAIAQHRLMATRTFIRQVLLGFVGLCAGALAAAGVVFVAGARSPNELPSWPTFAAAVAAVFVAVRVWTSVAEPSLSYLFGWRRRRIERAVTEFERRSLEARSTDEVRVCLADAVADAFDARLIEILPVERDRAQEHPSIHFAETSLRGAPVLRDLIDLDDARAPRQLDALDRLGADALVPLARDNNELEATAVIAGAALSPADDAIADELRRIGQRAALAWVNARLYHEVSRRSAGLEAQVRLRTAELEEALAELKAAQARLVEAERSSSLGLLVAGVSHEINNALNIIHGNMPTLADYAQLYDQLLQEPTPARATEDFRAVELARTGLPQAIAGLGEATRRTRAIVEDLRKFARPDTERRLVRVQEGVDAALNLLRRRTDGRLDIARIYSGTPSVDGYPGQLNQCFFNLLLNAVEAAKSEIWVVLRSIDHGGAGDVGGVELIISDDGEGVGAEDQERVFQPFFTTKARAAGLGLTVSRGIVERHGGTLQLFSEPGRGASVRLTLPPAAPAPDAHKAERTRE